MSSIKLRVKSGRKTFNFDIHNVDPNERTHNIQVRLPDEKKSAPQSDSDLVATMLSTDFPINDGSPPVRRAPRIIRRSMRDRIADDVVIMNNESHINEIKDTTSANHDTTSANHDTEPLDDTENIEINIEEIDDDDADNGDSNNTNDDEEKHSLHNDLMSAIQEALLRSIANLPPAVNDVWNTTGTSPPEPVIMNSGSPTRQPIPFETLISGHPRINELRRTRADSLAFYKEIITSLDIWLRAAMQAENQELATFAQTLDKTVAMYLLKFARVVSDDIFAKMIRFMEEETLGQTTYALNEKRKLIHILRAIKERVLDDIINIFDTPDCPCERCKL